VFSPDFLLLMVLIVGLVFGCCAGIIVLITLLAYLLKPELIRRVEEYEAEVSIRIIAVSIDFVFISIVAVLTSILISVASSTINIMDLFFYFINTLNPYSLFLLISELINPIYIYAAIPALINNPNPNVLTYISLFMPYLTSFLYFFIFDTFANGKTLGKRIFRVKSINASGRPVKYYEALINSAGKSFFFLGDLVIGVVVFALRESKGVFKQYRLTQQIADILVVRSPRNLKC
jgi:uncharacterized RDD family membrane protein YckC